VELACCWLAAMGGETDGARSHVASSIELADRFDHTLIRLQATIIGGWADALRGDATGVARADGAYAEYVARAMRLFTSFFLLLRAEAQLAIGDRAAATALARQSHAVGLDTGDVCRSPRLLTLADSLAHS